MRTLGIDLAAQPKKTAMCAIDWAADGTITVEEPEPELALHDGALLDWMRRADAVGIDAPFGWPRFFTENLSRYAKSSRWPAKPEGSAEGWIDQLRYRETDRFVRTWTEKLGTRLSPLSVSSDRIAYCAWRCAGLLHEHARERQGAVDRTGATSHVFEVYPAAALLAWGLPHKGYKPGSTGSQKSQAAEKARAEILDGLARGSSGWLDPATGGQLRTRLVHGPLADDRLDAFVSALVARAAARGLTEIPEPGQRELAREEGWIHLPRLASLEHLAHAGFA